MLYNTKKFCFLGLCLLFSSQLLAISQAIEPFEAIYTIKYKGVSIAQATRTLKIDNTGHYLFSLNTRSTVPLIKFKIFETSKGAWLQSGPHPDEYVYRHQGLKKKRHLISRFDWHKHMNFSRKNERRYQVKIPDDAHDKLSYQLALRQDLLKNKKTFVYHMANKGKVSTYIFEQMSQETLKTPIGKIKTIKMQRTNTNPKHGTVIFWLAPQYHFLPIKIIGIEKGKIVAEAHLKNYSIP